MVVLRVTVKEDVAACGVIVPMFTGVVEEGVPAFTVTPLTIMVPLGGRIPLAGVGTRSSVSPWAAGGMRCAIDF